VNLALVEALRESTALYAATEIAHTLGFIVLVGAVFFFDLRVLGLVRTLSLSALARLLLPWSWASVVVIIPTGLAMFAVHADELLDSRPFKLKMALLLAAGLNAAFFLTGPWQTVKQWDVGVSAPLAAKLSAIASLFLWTGVISCGRLLAYF
jgi:Family of unknown function (DUF6644)